MADSEDWNAEIQRNPENTFSLCAFQIQSDRQPKTAFLRYVRCASHMAPTQQYVSATN